MISMLMLHTFPNHVMAELCGVFAAFRFDHLILWRRKKGQVCSQLFLSEQGHGGLASWSGVRAHLLQPAALILPEQEAQIKTQ